jgi:hypothetical protein
MIRVNRQIKCPKSWGPGSSPIPYRKFFFENYTYLCISETILSNLTKPCPNVPGVILFESYVQYGWGPKKGTRGGLKWLIILIFKNLLLVNQQCQKIDTCTWHITLINLENRNPVWPNDFDLQLGCCISDAFSIFSSPAFRPCELLSSLFVRRLSSVVRPSTFHILIFSSETTGPIATKLWWNGTLMAPFQICVRWSRLPTKMAAKLKIEKKGGWNFNCPLLP